MADVTISGLSPSTPSKDTAIIPFSDGSTTYKTSPSGIVAAAPGCWIQMVKSTDAAYAAQVINADGTGVNTWVPGLSATITPRSASSTILMHIDAYVLLYANNTTRVGQAMYGGYRIKRNNTVIYDEAAIGGATRIGGGPYYGGYSHKAEGLKLMYTDAHGQGTVPLTYSFDVMMPLVNYGGYTNQQAADIIRVRGGAAINSYVYLMEIAG